jgi:hypothetical protein
MSFKKMQSGQDKKCNDKAKKPDVNEPSANKLSANKSNAPKSTKTSKKKTAKTNHGDWNLMKAESDPLIIAEGLQKEWEQQIRNFGKFEIYRYEGRNIEDFASYVIRFNVPAGKKIVPVDGTTMPTPLATKSSIDMLVNLHNTFTQLMQMDPPLEELTTKRLAAYLEKIIPRTDADAFECEVGCVLPFARRASVEEFMEVIDTGKLASKALEEKKEAEEEGKGKGKKGKTKAEELSSTIDRANELMPHKPSDGYVAQEDEAADRGRGFDDANATATSADTEEVPVSD